jgi:hypothetical protein
VESVSFEYHSATIKGQKPVVYDGLLKVESGHSAVYRFSVQTSTENLGSPIRPTPNTAFDRLHHRLRRPRVLIIDAGKSKTF